MTKFLGLGDVLCIHADQLARYGGDEGLRDQGLLDAAVAMPQSGVGGVRFHQTLFEQAAACLFHVVRNHPFVDGNKRTGTASALTFLALNGYDVDVGTDELASLVLDVATGTAEKADVAKFLRLHAVDRGGS